MSPRLSAVIVGLTRAVHQGLEQASGETLLLAKPDGRVNREGIACLLETPVGDRSVAAPMPRDRPEALARGGRRG